MSTGPPASSLKDVRLPRTHLSGMVKAGTYLTGRGKEFWFVTRGRRFPVLGVDGEQQPCRSIILTVNNNERLKDEIISKMRQGAGPAPFHARRWLCSIAERGHFFGNSVVPD